MEKVLGKSKLDNFNTIINYNYFDKKRGNCFNYPFITSVKSKLNKFSWKIDISDKILNALCYVYIKKKDEKLDEDSCKYLYYWLGSKILTNLLHTDFFFEVIYTIYRILNKSEIGKICDPVKYNIYHYNFYKFKTVYDLAEDYNTYKLHLFNLNPSCDKDYHDELQSYLYFYNKLRNECTIEKTKYHEEYCVAFNEYFTDKENGEISLWKCNLIESEEQVQQLEERHSGDEEKAQLPARPEIRAGQKHHWQEFLETEEFAEHLSTLHTGLHAENTYTPAGTWLSKLLGRNKGPSRNPYANQEIMADFSMPEDFYSERNRYCDLYARWYLDKQVVRKE
ncbi:VIR protein [Plasmodium vivax]|uniref:VIR protein n=1 Tax=Plasmodium vivax TaxID=5855 RepID=A0A1G4EIM6_PLAVI|nr:VIR protein [Plasmodium vivax]